MSTTRQRVTPVCWLLIGILLGVLSGWAVFHQNINRYLSSKLLLRAQSPAEMWFEDVANQSAHPEDLLKRCWATGKVVHRQLVLEYLKDKAVAPPEWFSLTQPLLVAAATDADMSARELALATLEATRDSQLQTCAAAQLTDLDPLVRLLGLEYLRKTDSRQGIPLSMRLLDDPDLRVVARAEVGLMRWTGADFGVRARLALPTGSQDPTNLATIRQGIAKRKEWWSLHQHEFPSAIAPRQTMQLDRAPISDFTLRDLEDHRVHLSDFRGKTVLVNFWATWCTACLAEIPDLIELQKKADDHLVILGVALDGAPDEHGDTSETENEGQAKQGKRTLEAIRAKVSRAAKTRGINYKVLLDPSGMIGGRFNGGELPTTLIVDTGGRLRRRFVGERDLAVFRAMLSEVR